MRKGESMKTLHRQIPSKETNRGPSCHEGTVLTTAPTVSPPQNKTNNKSDGSYRNTDIDERHVWPFINILLELISHLEALFVLLHPQSPGEVYQFKSMGGADTLLLTVHPHTRTQFSSITLSLPSVVINSRF